MREWTATVLHYSDVLSGQVLASVFLGHRFERADGSFEESWTAETWRDDEGYSVFGRFPSKAEAVQAIEERFRIA